MCTTSTASFSLTFGVFFFVFVFFDIIHQRDKQNPGMSKRRVIRKSMFGERQPIYL